MMLEADMSRLLLCLSMCVCVQYENCFNNHGNPKLEPGHRSHKKMLSWERRREGREGKRGRRAGGEENRMTVRRLNIV